MPKIREMLTDESKWIKHRSFGYNNLNDMACCLVGWVYVCYPGASDSKEVVAKLRDRIGPYITRWNDAPERTYKEVKDLADELDI